MIWWETKQGGGSYRCSACRREGLVERSGRGGEALRLALRSGRLMKTCRGRCINWMSWAVYGCWKPNGSQMRDFVRQRHEGETGAGRRRLAAATGCFGTPIGARDGRQITMFQQGRQGDAGTACYGCCSWLRSVTTRAGCSRLAFHAALEIEAQGRAQGVAVVGGGGAGMLDVTDDVELQDTCSKYLLPTFGCTLLKRGRRDTGPDRGYQGETSNLGKGGKGLVRSCC
jgi:hypothetical protein